MSQLVTGEAVTLDLTTAGVPSRILAALLDGMVQGLLFFVCMLLAGVASGSDATFASLTIFAIVVAGLAYPIALETLLKGRTLGKMALGLRVVRDDGGPIAFRQAFVRGLVGFFLERPGVTSGAAAVFSALLSSKGKRVGDFAAGTIVVQTRVARPRSDLVTMPPPLAAWATTLDLSRLPDDLALSARSFLGRFSSLTPAAQEALGGQLSAAVAAVVTPEPPSGVPDWAYLSAVLAERRRRAELQHSGLTWSYGPSPENLAAGPPLASPYFPATTTPPAVPVEEALDSPFAPPS